MDNVIHIGNHWDVLLWVRQDIKHYKETLDKKKEIKYIRAYNSILRDLMGT